jgi:hypothetical protein
MIDDSNVEPSSPPVAAAAAARPSGGGGAAGEAERLSQMQANRERMLRLQQKK